MIGWGYVEMLPSPFFNCSLPEEMEELQLIRQFGIDIAI